MGTGSTINLVDLAGTSNVKYIIVASYRFSTSATPYSSDCFEDEADGSADCTFEVEDASGVHHPSPQSDGGLSTIERRRPRRLRDTDAARAYYY